MYEEGAIADGPNGQTLIFRGGQWVPMGAAAPQPVTIGTADPTAAYAAPKAAADLARTNQQMAQDAALAPITAARAQAELDNLRNPRSAPPSGYRFKANGDLEPIPGGPIVGPQGVKRGNGALDAIVGQVNDYSRLYRQGAGATSGVGGLADYLPGQFSDANARQDAAANLLEETAVGAFKVAGSGSVTDADARRLAAAYKPTRYARDAGTRQQLAGLRDRIDAARSAAGLPAAVWEPDTAQTIATGATKTVRDESKSPAIAALQSLLRSGAPDDQVRAAASALGATDDSVGAALAFRRKNPGYRGSYDLTSLGTRQEATTARERLSGSATGAFLANAANEAGAGIPGALLGTDALEAQRAAYPGASLAGQVTGGVAAASGIQTGLARGAARLGGGAASRLLASPITADAVYGATAGATGNPDDPLTGAAVGTTVGTLGGMFGRGAARFAGRAVRGVRNADVRYLRDRGIPLTAGQAMGGALKGVEDRLSGVPVVGDAINNRRREGLAAFNLAALNEAAEPLARQTTPLAANIGATGPEGIEALRAARTVGYGNAVRGRFASIDPQYQTDYAASLTAARAIPNTGAEVAAEIDAVAPGYFSTGSISGENAQGAIRELKGLRRSRQNDALGHRTGEAVRGAERAMEGLFNRQAPGFTADLARANEVQTGLKTLEAAQSNAGNQVDALFTPAQVNRASIQSANRLTGQGATTNRPFYELATRAQEVLPSRVPDSGTAGRWAMLALPSALGGTGAAAGYVGGDAQTGGLSGLALGALLTAGGSRPAQRALTAALLDRPDAAVRIGNRIYNGARVGGMFGAGAAPILLAGP